MVAQLRGAEFKFDDSDGKVWPKNGGNNWRITELALRDVWRWLGFKNSDLYLYSLEKERDKIFLRAKD